MNLLDFIAFKKAQEKIASRCHAPGEFLEDGGNAGGFEVYQ